MIIKVNHRVKDTDIVCEQKWHCDAVKLRRLSGGDGLFYDFKDALAHAYLPPAFVTGGLYPAALARSLAALRRSALYGSRTDTQRLGTVKV